MSYFGQDQPRGWKNFLIPELGGLSIGVAETGAQMIPLIPVASVVALIAVLGVLATGVWGRRIIGTSTTIVALVTALVTAFTVLNINVEGSEGIAGWAVLVVVLCGGLVLTSLQCGDHWRPLATIGDKISARLAGGDSPRPLESSWTKESTLPLTLEITREVVPGDSQ